MPDVELLMEAWPPEFEEVLGNVDSLTPELDMPLEDYARMVSSPPVELGLYSRQPSIAPATVTHMPKLCPSHRARYLEA